MGQDQDVDREVSSCVNSLLDAVVSNDLNRVVTQLVEDIIEQVEIVTPYTDCYITGYAFSKLRARRASDSPLSASDSDDSAVLCHFDSSEVESLSENEFFERLNEVHNRPVNSRPRRRVLRFEPVKVRGELDINELPPVESLGFQASPELRLQLLGNISGIVGTLVVVESAKDVPALDMQTVLFLEDRSAIGQVFDIFGPVQKPYYSVRFNSSDDIKACGLCVGLGVFFAGETKDYTNFILPAQLSQLHCKGSDASWSNDIEPPPACVDYSDDEAEKLAKQKAKAKRSRRNRNTQPQNDDWCGKRVRNDSASTCNESVVSEDSDISFHSDIDPANMTSLYFPLPPAQQHLRARPQRPTFSGVRVPRNCSPRWPQMVAQSQVPVSTNCAQFTDYHSHDYPSDTALPRQYSAPPHFDFRPPYIPQGVGVRPSRHFNPQTRPNYWPRPAANDLGTPPHHHFIPRQPTFFPRTSNLHDFNPRTRIIHNQTPFQRFPH